MDGRFMVFHIQPIFTPVCTTELGTVANYYPEFKKRNVKVIALSVDGVESHIKWINDINETQKILQLTFL
jgi:alkyl hydroperoxide reductase subunit AhpC